MTDNKDMTTRIPMLKYKCRGEFYLSGKRTTGLFDIDVVNTDELLNFLCKSRGLIRIECSSQKVAYRVSDGYLPEDGYRIAKTIQEILCKYERWNHQAREWTIRI